MTLPGLVILNGDASEYIDEIYEIYINELVNKGLTFRHLPISYQFRPLSNGKGFGFWHIISTGPDEDSRVPDMRRCERIRWVPWLIENVVTDDRISWWENKRGKNTHVVIWIEEKDFAVILAKRKGYYLLKTAYKVSPRRKKTFEKERQRIRS